MKIRTECSNSRSNKWVTAVGDGKENKCNKTDSFHAIHTGFL